MTYSGDTTIITSDSKEQAIRNSFDPDNYASHRIPVIIRSKEIGKCLPTSKAKSLRLLVKIGKNMNI